jgi:predicted nucleic acid-binding protein
MRYLLDTGILVRVLHRSDPLNSDVREAMRRLAGAGHQFVTTRQNVAEFWSVCTRPATARGGFGLSAADAAYRLRVIERFIFVLNEPESAYRRWKALVQRHNVLGRQVHDSRIVAVMSAHRIRRILTLNLPDFARFSSEVVAMAPADILAAGRL